MTNPIVFLDFDGVVMPAKSISEAWANNRKFIKHEVTFNKECTDRLNTILERSNADLVICSGWRNEEYIQAHMVEVLIANGVRLNPLKYLGITPDINNGHRGYEIQAWIESNKFLGKFVIIDDEEDMMPMMDYLVNTNSGLGITDEDVEKALKILGIA